MGCDGGTIPTRDELVKLKKKPEKKDKDSERAFKWKHCALSQEPLRPPIVVCELGRLYNKESVIELLLDRTKFPGAGRCDHIRGLKDVKAIQFTDNPAYRDPEGDKGGAYRDTNTSQYICPISGLEMSGKYRFCFLYGCGCVFAERALKEIKTETCNKCAKPYIRDDIILLNGTDDEADELAKRMDERRMRAKLEKKSKRKHKLEDTDTAVNNESGQSSDSTDGATASKQQKTVQPSSTDSSKVPNGITDSKSKLTATNGSSSTKNGSLKQTNGKTTDDAKFKSIQDDPKVSSVYKSLFTTSHKAKNQQKGHWVTYNPQYN